MQKYILKEKSLQELTILELFSLVADTKNLLSKSLIHKYTLDQLDPLVSF